MAMTTAERVRENRLRRVAKRQGLTVRKTNPRRDPRAADYGARWELLRKANLIAGPFTSLDALEEALVYDVDNPPQWVVDARQAAAS